MIDIWIIIIIKKKYIGPLYLFIYVGNGILCLDPKLKKDCSIGLVS